MDILDKIIAHKKKEVESRKEIIPVKLLESSVYFSSPSVSLKKYLQREDKNGIIAEIKRKSPSKGNINPYVNIERTSIGYMMAGASALSILTDKEFLLKIYNKIPNLLKYIPYNIYANNEFNKFQIYVLLDKGEVSLIRIILI